MQQDLAHYLETEWPRNLNLDFPDLAVLCYYPLKIAEAEWMNFIDAMEYCVEGCEYRTESHFLKDTASLDSRLRSLLSWRRRSRDMTAIVRSTKEFIQQPHSSRCNAWDELESDYEHIAQDLDRLGSRFEALSAAIPPLIQVVEGRRMFHLARLTMGSTLLTLVFLPFIFAANLFSMTGDTAPGAKKFWIYFAVSGTILLLAVIAVLYWFVLRISFGYGSGRALVRLFREHQV
jgi:Mg2+ and Co2+ transporter CorA